jgi:nuclear pore complex protein Nup62
MYPPLSSKYHGMLTISQQLSQIVRVLNGHLTQLQWIDANASSLQAKVAAAQKSNNNLGGHGGVEHDAAESFYRSYMGRR